MTRDVLDALSLLAFWVLLFLGSGSVLARVAYYRAHGYRRPRLLTRDAIMLGGFSLSFGLVLFARVASGQGGISTEQFRASIPWGLLTSVPAVVAVAAFTYYELFVIERGSPTTPTRDHG